MTAHWFTCALCSSLGLDTAVGTAYGDESRAKCSSCGGPWPMRTIWLDEQESRRLDELKARFAPALRAMAGLEDTVYCVCPECFYEDRGQERPHAPDCPVADGCRICGWWITDDGRCAGNPDHDPYASDERPGERPGGEESEE